MSQLKLAALQKSRRLLIIGVGTALLVTPFARPAVADLLQDIETQIGSSMNQQGGWGENLPINPSGGGDQADAGITSVTNFLNSLLNNPLAAIMTLLNGQYNNLLKDIQGQLAAIYGTGNCPIIYNYGPDISGCGTPTGGGGDAGDTGGGTTPVDPGTGGNAGGGTNPANPGGGGNAGGNSISSTAIQQSIGVMGIPDPAVTEQMIRDRVLAAHSSDISGLDPVTYGQLLANESDRFLTGVNAESGLSTQAQIDRKADITSNAGVMQTITKESQLAQTKDVTQDVMKLYTLQQGQASTILGQMYTHQLTQEPVAMISNLNLRNISRTLDQDTKERESQIVNTTAQESTLAGLNGGWYNR